MEKIQLLPMKKCKGFRIKTARTYVEAIARQIGKNHGQAETYLIMPSRNSKPKFFSQTMRDLVISTKFSMKFHYKIVHFPNFRYKCRTISNEEKKFTSPSISSYAFPNVTRQVPKLVLFLKRPAVTVMHGKNSTASDGKNAKVSESRQLEHM